MNSRMHLLEWILVCALTYRSQMLCGVNSRDRRGCIESGWHGVALLRVRFVSPIALMYAGGFEMGPRWPVCAKGGCMMYLCIVIMLPAMSR